ncbi:MAG: hypothetical protein JW755_03780 [Candidatus Aminicenantes bacterium]|nr:hypothetical protein [Candidatus Aminicenantes bacterium]
MKRKTKIAFIFTLICFLSFSLFAQQQETVEPVNWRELVPFLKDLPNWEAVDEATGQTMSMGMYSATNVEREYSSGEKVLTISIIDGALSQMAYAGFNMMRQFEVDTSDEFVKKVEIKEYPGIERYEYEYKNASVMLLVAERFLIEIEITEAENTNEAKEIAEALDLDGLADLVK